MSPIAQKNISLKNIKLTNFRNYDFLDFAFEDCPIVIAGQNGSGKTNLLEAISLLTSGRGLRNAKLETIGKFDVASQKQANWTVFADIATPTGEITIATTRNIGKDGDKRIIKINGEVINSQLEIKNYFSVCSLTPQMDQIFLDGTTSRRMYLDKITALFYPDHTRQLSIYNYARSERIKILSQNNYDEIWLNTIEKRMAEQACAIAAARNEIIAHLQQTIDGNDSVFPKAKLSINGLVESDLHKKTALEAEKNLQQKLRNSRNDDAQTGRTLYGVHRSDFIVIHALKKQPAQICSTGEQKALLLSITLATAKARKLWLGIAPILLLDEVVAHLDKQKRHELFNELLALNTQTFLTGTDMLLFAELKGKCQALTVDNGFVLG